MVGASDAGTHSSRAGIQEEPEENKAPSEDSYTSEDLSLLGEWEGKLICSSGPYFTFPYCQSLKSRV